MSATLMYNNIYNTTFNSCNCACKRFIKCCKVKIVKDVSGNISSIVVNKTNSVNIVDGELGIATIIVQGRDLRSNEYLFVKADTESGDAVVWVYYKNSGVLTLGRTNTGKAKIFKCLGLKKTSLFGDGKGTLVRNGRVVKENVKFTVDRLMIVA